MRTIEFEDDDTFVIEVEHAAKRLGFSFQDTVSLLVGLGLSTAIEIGLLDGRATRPMDRGELLTRMAAKLMEDERQ